MMQEEQLLSPFQIIVADDKKAIRTGLSYMIQRVSHEIEVLEAANGLEAWNFIQLTPHVRMAFVDIRMPGLDGLQLCEKIRLEGKNIKVVIVSAYREFDYARQALRYGVSDYLLKPVNPTDVVHLVKNTLTTYQERSTKTLTEDDRQARLVIEQVRKWVHDHLDQDITLADLAEKFHYTPNYLSALFKKQIGKGFLDYLADCRMQRATHLLKDPALRMSQIAVQVGYTNARAFSIAFRKTCGTTPTEYREHYGIDSVE